MIKLTVTVATYNRANLLNKVLSALAMQTLSPNYYEIIVCDSHSIDNTNEIVKTFSENHKHIKIRHLHTKNILAAKRNLGIENAQNEVIIFLDDDCVPDKNFLEIYYNLFQKEVRNNGRVVYCGEVRFPKEWVEASNYYRFRDSRHFGSGRKQKITKLDFRTIVVMNMAFLKKDFLESIQQVNEAFIGYGCEDQDLGWQFQKNGYSLLMCDALITHYEMSGDISGYAKKIFHTARDGMTTLLRVNPKAACSLGLKFRLIEPSHPSKKKLEQEVTKILINTIFNHRIAEFISFILKKYDNNRFIYLPPLYRYVLSCSYVKGALSRKNSVKISNEWYD